MFADYTQADIARFRSYGYETDNGIAYDFGLASSAGGYFILLREAQHTDADIEQAKRELRHSRDVVSMRVVEVKA